MSGSHDIDHGIMDTQFKDDTNADPEGAEVRDEANQRATRTMEPWVADEFGWVFKPNAIVNGASDAEIHAAKLLDSNWRFQAHNHIVTAVEEACDPIYKRRLLDFENTDEGKEMGKEYYRSFKDLITLAADGVGGDQWCAYGLSLSLMAQGCKEIASAARFAQRAESWQNRCNVKKDFKEMGPSNMLEKAVAQALRGVAICESITKAYNSTVTDPNAARLKKNFKTATYTAMGIEANSKKKNYDHPGKAAEQEDAGVGAASAVFKDFYNK